MENLPSAHTLTFLPVDDFFLKKIPFKKSAPVSVKQNPWCVDLRKSSPSLTPKCTWTSHHLEREPAAAQPRALARSRPSSHTQTEPNVCATCSDVTVPHFVRVQWSSPRLGALTTSMRPRWSECRTKRTRRLINCPRRLVVPVFVTPRCKKKTKQKKNRVAFCFWPSYVYITGNIALQLREQKWSADRSAGSWVERSFLCKSCSVLGRSNSCIVFIDPQLLVHLEIHKKHYYWPYYYFMLLFILLMYNFKKLFPSFPP